MTIVIMQPYVFPYLGYFQLIHASTKFVFLEDVSFIKKGWINRNRILDTNGNDSLFTIPLENVSQNRTILDHYLHETFPVWKDKFYKTLHTVYAKAPFYEITLSMMKHILDQAKPGDSIAKLAETSIKFLSPYLGIWPDFINSSTYGNHNLRKEHRLIDICKKEYDGTYINAIGGQSLYTKESFKAQGINLFFIKSELLPYKQFENTFVPGLSIIDALMFCDPETLHKLVSAYTLV